MGIWGPWPSTAPTLTSWCSCCPTPQDCTHTCPHGCPSNVGPRWLQQWSPITGSWRKDPREKAKLHYMSRCEIRLLAISSSCRQPLQHGKWKIPREHTPNPGTLGPLQPTLAMLGNTHFQPLTALFQHRLWGASRLGSPAQQPPHGLPLLRDRPCRWHPQGCQGAGPSGGAEGGCPGAGRAEGRRAGTHLSEPHVSSSSTCSSPWAPGEAVGPKHPNHHRAGPRALSSQTGRRPQSL